MTTLATNDLTANQPAAPAPRPLLVTGYWLSQMIHVTAKLGLADLLDEAPRTCAELAHVTGAHAPSLARLLRALVGSGIVEQMADGRFKLTPVGDPLRTNSANSSRAFAILLGEEHYRAWGRLYHSVMTGETGFDSAFGCNLFEYLEKTPAMADQFHAAMGEVASRLAPAVMRAYDFSGVSSLVDVGGGAGALLTAILTGHPHLRGIVYDAPAAVARASQRLHDAGLATRGQALAGNFFDTVPPADTYILRGVIHDWDDERSRTILSNCRRAMRAPGRVLLVEHILPEDSRPSFSRLQDLDMLVMTGGRERTEGEYRELFAASGFTLARVIPTSAMIYVLEGTPLADA